MAWCAHGSCAPVRAQHHIRSKIVPAGARNMGTRSSEHHLCHPTRLCRERMVLRLVASRALLPQALRRVRT
jgi:hypothetical protein